MKILRTLMVTLAIPAIAATTLVSAPPASAVSLTRVTNFGANPSGLNMYVYVPAKVAPKPALLVVLHYCTGSASAVFGSQAKEFVTAADKYGYVMLFPETTKNGQCFDVFSSSGLKRGGGGDSTGVASAVDYAKKQYKIDPTRVYVTGFSSGAMMTNVMAAEYPDVFAAGAVFAGVPATCFSTTGGSTWNNQCSGGQIVKTAQQWGDAARAMYPGYTGTYPRMQLMHGVSDTTLNYKNFGEEIKQWTNLNKVTATPVATDQPKPGWTRTRYGNGTAQAPVEGISVANAGHSIPLPELIPYAIAFLGLDKTS